MKFELVVVEYSSCFGIEFSGEAKVTHWDWDTVHPFTKERHHPPGSTFLYYCHFARFLSFLLFLLLLFYWDLISIVLCSIGSILNLMMKLIKIWMVNIGVKSKVLVNILQI